MLPFERLEITSAPTWQFCEIGWQWSPPSSPNFVLWFVQSGHGEMVLNETQFKLSGGTTFILQPETRVRAGHDPLHPLRAFTCHFTLEAWQKISLWPDGAVVNDATLFVLSAQRTQTLWQRGDVVGREMSRRVVEQMVLGLWDESHQPIRSALDCEFDELADSIRREPARAWNLDDMAFSVNLSRAQFVRRFRARLGCAPMALVTHTRLERSQQLLHDSPLSLDAIAHAVGYGDAPFLSKNFKSAFGLSPGAWRKLARSSQKNF